jgi:histidine triad (HIT) family protein
MTDCVFCGIVAGTDPATIVQEWPDAVAFVPLGPVIDGHTLVVPREHVDHAAEDPEIAAATMARAAEFAAGWHSANIVTSIGVPAKQSIFHLHIHVIPRAVDDGLMLPWGTTGNPHDPHWCRVAEGLQREVDERYPRRCSQCGQRWADRACGPTHALITEELGIGDLRRELAARNEGAA